MKPLALLVALSIAISPSAVFAKDKPGKGNSGNHGNKSENHAPSHPGGSSASQFSEHEKTVLKEYVSEWQSGKKKGKALPPGLQKKVARGGSLPPGWERKLNKGEILPEEVFKASQPLPHEVVIKLPAPPSPDVVIRAIEGKILKVHQKTREILDVLDPFK